MRLFEAYTYCRRRKSVDFTCVNDTSTMLNAQFKMRTICSDFLGLTLLLIILLVLSGDIFELHADGSGGYVVLSDGTKREGTVSSTGGKKVVVYGRKKHSIPFNKIVSITMHEKKREMLPAWYFKEDGSNEKIKSGESYPYIEYSAEVLTSDREKYAGTILPVVIYIETDNRKIKHIFRTKGKGKPGDTLESLVFPVIFVRGGGKKENTEKGITVRIVSQNGKPVFIDRNKLISVPAEKNSNVYSASDISIPLITAGSGNGSVYISPCAGMKEPGQKDRAQIEKLIKGLPDFYTSKNIIFLRQEGNRACALVESIRTEKTSFKKAKSFLRYDIWICIKDQDVWQYTRRIFVYRRACREPVPQVMKLTVLPAEWDIAIERIQRRKDIILTLPGRKAGGKEETKAERGTTDE